MDRNAKNGRVGIGGAEMDYVSFGRGEKNAVILPGLSDGLATVKGKALLLAPPYRSYFRDFTVYMFSRRNDLPDGFSIRDMADDQAEAMRSLGLEGSCVLGVSEGGMIAQCLAAYHPELVERLAIAVSAPCANDTVRDSVTRWIGYAVKGDHRSLMIDTAERSYSPARLKKYRRTYPVIGLIGKPKSYVRFLANANAILDFDISADLGKIACPTLIIGGLDDRIVGPDASLEMHELIPGSELYMYEGLGHAAYEEAGDFNGRVFGFFSERH